MARHLEGRAVPGARRHAGQDRRTDPRRHRRVPPATAPEPLLPAPLPETRQQMEVQQGNRNCNHSLKREKPARCAGIPLEPLNECCLAVKRMPLPAPGAYNRVPSAASPCCIASSIPRSQFEPLSTSRRSLRTPALTKAGSPIRGNSSVPLASPRTIGFIGGSARPSIRNSRWPKTLPSPPSVSVGARTDPNGHRPPASYSSPHGPVPDQ